MTIPMPIQERIRALDAQGVSGRAIAREVGVSRDTVAKYVKEIDYSPVAPVTAGGPGMFALTGFTDVIDEWLDGDRGSPRKQRHTARRVFDRLGTERGYTGSYSPVQRYVKAWRERARSHGHGFGELVWGPGTAQIDFGEADVFVAGVQVRVFLLVVTFPFSNLRLVQAYNGQTAECVCHGLRRIFEFMGVAPGELIFDNAISVGRRMGKKIIESRLFAAFKAHYRVSARYCNPNSGHEKGNVENAVGFLRRNILVPLPQVADLDELNELLWQRCLVFAQQEHWRKGVSIVDLFEEDKRAGLALPGVGFDPVRYESRRADKRGNILIESNTYSAGPRFNGRVLTVGIGHDTIKILDEYTNPIVTFDRVFGHHRQTIFEPSTQLPLLANKPGSWTHSPLRPLVTDLVRDWLDHAEHSDRARVFAVLDQTATATSFTSAVDAATHLITQGEDLQLPAVTMLAHRLHQDLDAGAPVVDLSAYDTITTHSRSA